MAALNLYLTNTITNGWQTLSQTSPGANAVTSPNTGWVVGKIASGNYASLDSAVERTTAGFTATVQPDGTLDSTLGDAFIVGPLSGEFANSAWTIQAALQSTTSATATNAVNLRFRVFRSSNIDGSGATEITASTILVPASTFYSLNTTGTQVTASNTWSPGTTLLLDSEYLFFQVACYINAASSSNSSDVNFRIGDTATIITTPDFVATNRDVTVSGVSLNSSVGTLDNTTTINTNGTISSVQLGDLKPSIVVSETGLISTASTGSISPSVQMAVVISGTQSLTTLGIALGANTVDASISATTGIGSVGIISNSITLGITKVQSVSSVGTLSATLNKSITSTTSSGFVHSFNSVLTSNNITLTPNNLGVIQGNLAFVGTTADINMLGVLGVASTGLLQTSQDVSTSITGTTGYITLGGAYGANVKSVEISGLIGLSSVYGFESALATIPIFGNTSTTKAGKLVMWIPSSIVLFREQEVSTFNTGHLRYQFATSSTIHTFSISADKVNALISDRGVSSFGVSDKYFNFPVTTIKYKVFTPTRNLVLLSSRSNYYNQG